MPDPLYDMINDLPAEAASDLDDALFAETRPAVTRKVTGQALADYVNGQLAEKPLATAGVGSVLGLDGGGEVVRMKGNFHTVQATDGGTDFSEAMQDMINYVSAKDQGGEIYIPPGKYRANAMVELKPKVSIRAASRAIIQAQGTMEALLGMSIGAASRLRGVSIQGGVWAGNYQADKLIWLRDFEQVRCSDLTLVECNGTYFHAGDPSAFSGCYELYMQNVLVNRIYNGLTTSGFTLTPAGNIGLKLDIADSQFKDIVTIATKIGIKGALYNSDIYAHHHWTFSPHGPSDYCVEMDGNDVDFYSCYADTVFTSAYKLNGDRYNFFGGRSLYGSGHSAAVDNVANVFEVTNGGNVSVFGFRFRATDSNKRLASDFTGSLGYVRNWDPKYLNVANPKFNNVGFRNSMSGKIQTVVGSDPIINSSMNLASVSRTGEGDYTFYFARNLPNQDYLIAIDIIPASFPASGITWQLRHKYASSFRIQFFDKDGNYISPGEVQIRAFGI